MQKNDIDKLIRVDHAGELGAKWIYEGQLKWIKDPSTKIEIQTMYDQEIEHLDYFTKEMQHRHVRPTALMPLWKLFGKSAGAISALLGPKAAMACTEAVEDVIDQHYQSQINMLESKYPEEIELLSKLKKFREDECHHRDTAAKHTTTTSPIKQLLKETIKLGVRMAISASKRI